MPIRNPRVTTVLDQELADWLKRRSQTEGRSVSLVVKDIIAKYFAEEEERFWAGEGERRLESFDPATSISHEAAWK